MRWVKALLPWAVTLGALGMCYVSYASAARVSSETRSALQSSMQQELARQRKSQEQILTKSLTDMKAQLDKIEEENRKLRERLEAVLPPK
jgi:septal ring factor EnvC (AmiA/AmiB activator)